jgi:hypothetical protein
MKFVIYTDGNEVIITTKKNEAMMLEQCFAGHGGEGDRCLEEYDRDESKDHSVSITCNTYRDW